MNNNIDNQVRKNIRSLKPYSSARDEYTGSGSIFLDANENPYGTLNRYPDPHQQTLKAQVSKLKNISAANIFLGNGSDEIIDLAFRIFCEPGKDKVCIFPPTYGMYKVSAGINDVGVVEIPLDQNFQLPVEEFLEMANKEKLKMAFICTPNNPTGNVLHNADIEKMAAGFSGILVIDEAYMDFSQSPSNSDLIQKYSNVIVMQTFSKAWGMAAARVGMAFSQRDMLKYFNRIKAPYNISTLNQKMVLEKISDRKTYNSEIYSITEEILMLQRELNELKIVEHVYPSQANFLLVRFREAKSVYQQLAKAGIIVRDRTAEVDGCLRITAGKPSENQKLIETLKKLER